MPPLLELAAKNLGCNTTQQNVEKVQEDERLCKIRTRYTPLNNCILLFKYLDIQERYKTIRFRSRSLLLQAVNIMECVLRKFGTYENFEEITGGSVLPKSRVWATVRKYLQKEGCVGEVCVFLLSTFPEHTCTISYIYSTVLVIVCDMICAGGGVSV